MKVYFKYLFSAFILFCHVGCKKMIEVDPPTTELSPEKAFANDQSALSVLSNIYSEFNSFIAGNLTPKLALYSDELTTSSSDGTTLEYYNSNVSINNGSNLNLWRNLYSVIYQSNMLLENIEVSPGLTQAVRKQLKGEALFLRAYAYFHLINTYGEVPLPLSTDVNITSSLSRKDIAKVYDQIIIDLLQAKSIMSTAYPSTEKVRANKWAAASLLARVYLYIQNWNAAEQEATEVINSGLYTPLENISQVFIKNSKESILQFWTQNGFTVEASLFIPSGNTIPNYYLTNELVNAFEMDDQRKNEWLNSLNVNGQTYYYPYKYKNRSSVSGGNMEYLTTLRISELFLIRAEARAKQNNILGAQDDLNVVRNRAGLSNSVALSQSEILIEVEKERRIEFFVEWGHRFYDLKRNDNLNSVLSNIKPNWQSTSILLPIPQYELLNNPNLYQNPGY